MRCLVDPLIACTLLGASAGAGCNDGEQAIAGLGEPIQIAGAQFVSGPLPGTLPPDAGPAGLPEAGTDAGAPTVPPLSVTEVLFQNAFIVSGLGGTSAQGLATSDSQAVGIALAGKGSGYWVVPVQGQDSQFPGQSDFGFSMSLDRNDKPGDTSLRVVAIDGSGHAGTQFAAPICIESRIPDNGHACFPHKPVPAAVFTMTWDVNFDVDLHVITPAGRDVNAKSAPTSIPIDGGVPGPTIGIVDRDSISQCIVDGWRQEDLVFQDPPPKGLYQVYAAPFAACGQPAVRFTLSIYEHASDGNLHSTFTRSGELLANDVTGGLTTGLFVAEKRFE
jgi:hypothetical protein